MPTSSFYQSAFLLACLLTGCSEGECLAPCAARLQVSAAVPASASVSVTACDGDRCGSAEVPSGACRDDDAELFSLCYLGGEVSASLVDAPRGPLEVDTSVPVSLTVTGPDGTVLLDESGVPEVSYEVHCGGFDCPQRSITF